MFSCLKIQLNLWTAYFSQGLGMHGNQTIWPEQNHGGIKEPHCKTVQRCKTVHRSYKHPPLHMHPPQSSLHSCRVILLIEPLLTHMFSNECKTWSCLFVLHLGPHESPHKHVDLQNWITEGKMKFGDFAKMWNFEASIQKCNLKYDLFWNDPNVTLKFQTCPKQFMFESQTRRVLNWMSKLGIMQANVTLVLSKDIPKVRQDIIVFDRCAATGALGASQARYLDKLHRPTKTQNQYKTKPKNKTKPRLTVHQWLPREVQTVAV